MKFFERIDKSSAWNLYRMGDGHIDRYNHAHGWWESQRKEAVPNLNDPEVFRPISLERVLFLKRIGV